MALWGKYGENANSSAWVFDIFRDMVKWLMVAMFLAPMHREFEDSSHDHLPWFLPQYQVSALRLPLRKMCRQLSRSWSWAEGVLMSWILLKVLCLDIHYLGFDNVWYPLQKLRVWYPFGNLWGTVLFLIRHSTSRLQLRQGSPYLDYEQLVLNSNKEGMDFLRKGQYKQGRLGSPGMLSDGFRMGFCWWIVLVVTVSAMLKLKRMVDGELMMVSRS